MNVISASAVTRRFGDFTAVDAVDLQVGAGEVVGLVGANGAGKTTLMRMILGVLEPTQGAIRLFGEPQTREQRRRVGYVPQNLGLYRDLTAAENLQFRAEVFGVHEANGSGYGPQLVRDLPLGIQRRAAFAAATQHDPELLVLDEPTSGVSPLARSALWDAIRERAEAGTAVLVSTHYMEEAEQADRVVMLSRGRVIAEGPADDIIGGRSTLEVRTERWADAFNVLDHDDRMITLDGTAIRVLGETANEVTAELAAAGIEAEADEAPATLEETMVLIES